MLQFGFTHPSTEEEKTGLNYIIIGPFTSLVVCFIADFQCKGFQREETQIDLSFINFARSAVT